MKLKINALIAAAVAAPALGTLTWLSSAPVTTAAALGALGALASYWIVPASRKSQGAPLSLTEPLSVLNVPLPLRRRALQAQQLLDQAQAALLTLSASGTYAASALYESRISRAQRILNDTVIAFSKLTPIDTGRFSQQIETLSKRELLPLLGELDAERKKVLTAQGKFIEAAFPEKAN